jgi:hypothetical protein
MEEEVKTSNINKIDQEEPWQYLMFINQKVITDFLTLSYFQVMKNAEE